MLFRSGNIGDFTKENEKMYLDNGHSKNDIVGTSYIEFQYDKYLKGTKNKYEVYNNNYKLIEEGKKGNDIYMTIDIELQKEIEQILIEEIIATQKELNTEYFNKSYIIVTQPNTGEILAMAGKMVVDTKVYDNTA